MLISTLVDCCDEWKNKGEQKNSQQKIGDIKSAGTDRLTAIKGQYRTYRRKELHRHKKEQHKILPFFVFPYSTEATGVISVI